MAYRTGGGLDILALMRCSRGGPQCPKFWCVRPFRRSDREQLTDLVNAHVRAVHPWNVSRRYADGSLPAPGVYGVPEQWPHIRALYERAGFVHQGHTEVLMLAVVDELPPPGPPPFEGLRARRALGVNGTRLSACLGDEEIGYIEVDTGLAEAGRLVRLGGWADVGNLNADYRRRGVATWLMGQAAGWLRLGRIDRLLGYAMAEEEGGLAFLHRVGFREVTRTSRDWIHPPTERAG
jgi:GNAT superfamily N-acetyltransferase